MIKVKVTAVLDIAKLIGGREQFCFLPKNSTVKELINYLIIKNGFAVADRIYGNQENETKMIKPDLILYLNGRQIIFLNGSETVLQDGDEFLMMPLAGGG